MDKNRLSLSPWTATVSPALSKIVKECQNVISYVCMETLFTRGGMQESVQTDLLLNVYHGFDNLASQSEMFVRGEGAYSCLFDDTDDLNGIGGLKTLRNEITQDATTKFAVTTDTSYIDVGKNSIPLKLLQLKFPKSDKRISGDTIKNKGAAVLANCKVAIPIGAQFLDKNGKLPSGRKIQDYLEHVLDGMYKKLVLEDKCKNVASSNDREKIMGESRPKGWIFNGFMAFVAFGPLALKDSDKSNMMMHGMLFDYYLFYNCVCHEPHVFFIFRYLF
jgi:hypothetical protein